MQDVPHKRAVCIPNLARGFHTWREAVRQWEQGDPVKGVEPLRDWDASLYTKSMRQKMAVKRNLRRIIAEEYNR
jgi:hypothetical protein